MDTDKKEERELPEGWELCKLPDFTRIEMGQSPPSHTYNSNEEGLPFFQGKAEFGFLYPSAVKFCSEPNRIAEIGATLLTVRAPVGPTNLANVRCCIGRGLAAIHPIDKILSEFVLLLFREKEPFISGQGKGSTFTAINKIFLEQLVVSLPPLPEQKRIVTKIEELFSELDAGEESFKQARKQLGIYRQSLLKQAFEGKLTEAWRAANPDQLEDLETLLSRIQQERESNFASEISEWESAHQNWLDGGEIGKKPPKPKKHKVMLSEGVSSFIRFSDAWNSFNLSELVLALRQGWSPKCHNHQASDDTWSVMTTTAIQSGNFIQTANKELPGGLHPRPWITLKLDDILITRAGPRLRCGIVCRVSRTKPKMMLCDKAYRLRFPSAIVSPKFMELLLISPDFSKSIEALKTGINDSGVNITQNGFLQLRVSIPALPEQQEIVRILETQFTVIEQNEREIDAALKRSEALRQSILKRAFSGKLIPQESSDEPASQLLARIQAEREKTAEHAKSQKKAAKKKAASKHAKKS